MGLQFIVVQMRIMLSSVKTAVTTTEHERIPVIIRQTTDSDREAIFHVEKTAFGHDKEALLVQSLLNDPTADPKLSLLAIQDKKPIGHILFTSGTIENTDLKVALLAPLAVIPEAQDQGVGGKLIHAGLEHLTEMDFDLVCVLGHPEYYPKYGFRPAHPHGVEAVYPIPEKHRDAWMLHSLNKTDLDTVKGQFFCANALNKLEHWQE